MKTTLFKQVQKHQLFYIILTGIFLRLISLLKQPIWFDEIASITVSQKPFIQLLFSTAADTHPPFYFLLLKLLSIFSVNTHYLRFFSLFIGTLTIWVTYKIIYKISSSKASLATALIIAINPLHIYASSQIRMYSLLTLQVLILVWLFIYFMKSERLSHLIIYGILGVTSLYTHYYAALVLFALNLIYLIIKKRNIFDSKAWYTTQIFILIFFLPWLYFSASLSQKSCWCFTPSIGLPITFFTFGIGGVGLVTVKDLFNYAPAVHILYFILLTGYLFYFFMKGCIKLILEKNLLPILLFFLPMVTVTIISLKLTIFSPRALIIISPFYYYLIYEGAQSFNKKLNRNITLIVTLFLLIGNILIQSIDPYYFNTPINKTYLLNPDKKLLP